MDECCGKYLDYTSSQELCKKDSNYNLGFICDNCSHAFGKQAHFYHCSLCKNDLCEECYEDQQVDTEGEEEESGEEQEDDGFILIGANRYDIKDEDIVKRAIQFYVNK